MKNVPFPLALVVPAFSFLLCCSTMTQEVSVTVPPGFSGEIQVQFCALDGGKPKLEFEADAFGKAKTSFCPKGQLKFNLVRDGKPVALSDRAVQLSQRGDGTTSGAILQVP